MADALQAGKLDLFIGVDVPAASNLNMIPLASEYLFCLIHDNILKECCPNHWQELLNKSATEGLDVSDLKDFPILLLASDNRIRSLLDRAYDRCGIMPKTILEAARLFRSGCCLPATDDPLQSPKRSNHLAGELPLSEDEPLFLKNRYLPGLPQ